MLAGAAALLAGALAKAAERAARAADGEPLLLGQTNTATGTTVLARRNPAATEAALSVTNDNGPGVTGANSGVRGFPGVSGISLDIGVRGIGGVSTGVVGTGQIVGVRGAGRRGVVGATPDVPGGSIGVGVTWDAAEAGTGVQGSSVLGTGVAGTSQTGTGVLVAACVPGRQGSEEQAGATLPPAQVEGWTHLGGQTDKDTLKTLSERFTQVQSRVTAEWVHVPPGSWVGLMEKLTPALAGGTPPDLTYMSTGRLDSLRRTGQVLELDPLVTRSRDLRPQDFDKPVLDAVRFGGKTWGLPCAGNSGGLGFYDTEAFAREGLAAPPASWDELVTVSKRLTKRDAGGGLSQMGFKGHTGAAWAWYPFLWGNGGEVYDRSGPVPKPAWHSPRAIESLQFLVDLIHRHRVWSLTEEPAGGEQAGKVGVWILGGSISAYLKLPELRWDAFRPFRKDGGKPVPARPGADYFNLYRTPRQEAAWEYLKYLVSPEPLATFAISRGGPPPRAAREHKVFKDFVAVTPVMRLQGEAMADPEAQPNPSFHGEAEAYAELLKHYQRALTQEACPGDALAEAAREATLVLERMYR